MGGYHLGIDFGTARTAAVLARPDGRREQLLLEPSAVCLDNAPQPFVIKGEALYCLVPVRSRP